MYVPRRRARWKTKQKKIYIYSNKLYLGKIDRRLLEAQMQSWEKLKRDPQFRLELPPLEQLSLETINSRMARLKITTLWLILFVHQSVEPLLVGKERSAKDCPKIVEWNFFSNITPQLYGLFMVPDLNNYITSGKHEKLLTLYQMTFVNLGVTPPPYPLSDGHLSMESWIFVDLSS